jgi:hypothetical protein
MESEKLNKNRAKNWTMALGHLLEWKKQVSSGNSIQESIKRY